MSATQSSTYGTGIGWGAGSETFFIATNCIDGITDTGKICHTKNDRYPWLALDFGKTFAINRVDIFNRHDCCGERTRNVEVRVSEYLPTSAQWKFSGGSLLGTFLGPGTSGQLIAISGDFPFHVMMKYTCITRPMEKWQVCHSPVG